MNKRYSVEIATDNNKAAALLAELRKEALVVPLPSPTDYCLIKCPECGRNAALMRRCHGDLEVRIPVYEESPGLAGLDYLEWDMKPDVGDTDPEYVCEYCGHVLFHGIDEVEEWLRKCHAMFGKEKADGDQT